MYVQGNGTLATNEYEFKTTSEGVINVSGLDAGTYTVHEKTVLDKYNSLPDFEFTISADGLQNKEGENDNKITVNFTKTCTSSLVKDPTIDENGTATIIVENKKGSNLPLTGLNGVTFTWIAGGAVLCIGVAHLIRSRKQAEESEQE